MVKTWYNAEEVLDIIFSHSNAPDDSDISGLENNDDVAKEQEILETECLPIFNEPDVPTMLSSTSSESEFNVDSEQLPIDNALINTMADTSEHPSTVTEVSLSTIPLASSTPTSLSESPQCSKYNEINFTIDDRRQTRYNINNCMKQAQAINLNGEDGDKGISIDSSSSKEKRQLPVDGARSNVKKQKCCTVTSNTKGKQKKKNTTAKEDRNYRWRKLKLPLVDTTFTGEPFSDPPYGAENVTPLVYFLGFFRDELFEKIVEQTNLFSVLKTGKCINTTNEEIWAFIGIQIRMSIVRMSVYRHYWAAGTRYAPIADVMPLNRYESLRIFLHFVDDSKKEEEENMHDKLFKIRPVLNFVRAQCNRLEQEPVQSIDEQIVPAKTKRSGIRQFNQRKPTKWGFKLYVRSGTTGIMYDFFLYCGKGSTRYCDCSPRNAVMELCAGIPRHKNFQIYFDNWFCTLALLTELKTIGILTTATIRADRTRHCPFDEKVRNRGAIDYRVDANSGIRIIKWVDNNIVHLASTYASVNPVTQVQRW